MTTSAELDSTYEAFLRERRAQILGRVAEACARTGRDPSEVSAIAVSKTVDARTVRLAHAAGWDAFGENRPQELVRKLAALEGDPSMAGVTFDMIGNLQRNKVNQVIGRVRLIESVSSAQLAEVVSSHGVARGLVSDVLLEVNVSGEASKSGFTPDGVRAAAEGLCALPGIRLRGLMTMAPAHDPSAARATFGGLRELADDLRARTGLALGVLSCGMSDDFELAVEEGSTLVRIGRYAFDQAFGL